jgi:aspartyl/glutamyl-tRNA(Asn/Gln) amidotransferase C subunit
LSRRAKTAVTPEEVRRLAALSKLEMTRAEEDAVREDISSILEYFRIVDSVPGSGGVPSRSLEPAELRRDEVGPSDPEGVLKGVRHRKGRLVRAPRVF